MNVTEILNIIIQESDSHFKPDICLECGEPTNRVIEIDRKKRIIPRNCKCRRKYLQEREKIKNEELQKERQLRVEQIINNSLMDIKFKNSTFENWDSEIGNPKMLALGQKYVREFNKMKKGSIGLLVYGIWGNGKTYLCSCIANALISQLIPVVCVSINSLLERISQTYYSRDDEGTSMILQSLNNADLLIIDDLGTEQHTEWSKSMVYNIIDSRYRSGLPLIVTTNLTDEELKKRYHERTYNRLIEMCTPINNTWGSIREEKGREKTKILSGLLG